ncbi:hypothetical protein C8J57DRAFT_1678292 [Mycena rebaudengoi]|nr:hypothetical protein C8J57DRAFT_1678292 [Mycena rebaudengoi]
MSSNRPKCIQVRAISLYPERKAAARVSIRLVSLRAPAASRHRGRQVKHSLRPTVGILGEPVQILRTAVSPSERKKNGKELAPCDFFRWRGPRRALVSKLWIQLQPEPKISLKKRAQCASSTSFAANQYTPSESIHVWKLNRPLVKEGVRVQRPKQAKRVQVAVAEKIDCTIIQERSANKPSRIKGTNLIPGGEYGTALKAAVHNADSDIVALLLSNGADPNIQGGKYDTALQGMGIQPSQDHPNTCPAWCRYIGD